jgi:dethiobiotin synthetase
MKRIVIAGIGTEIGKTFISSVIVEALQADYWKPVQAGSLDQTDTDFVRLHTSNSFSVFHPEGYRLTAPMSPHAAAAAEGININLGALSLPATQNHLVIELAGGIMVPLNNRQLNIDLLEQWQLPVILVSQNYLGSINHTLLSLEVLEQRKINVAGLIFNGPGNSASEDFIMQYSGLACLAKINFQQEVSQKTIRRLAGEVKEKLDQFL